MRDHASKLSCARFDCVIVILRARRSAAPFLYGRPPIEQPLHAPTRRRIENANRVGAPIAIYQQGPQTLADLTEIGRGCASPLTQTAVPADEFAVRVPQNEAAGSAQQFSPHSVRLDWPASKRGRQQYELGLEGERDGDILAIRIGF